MRAAIDCRAEYRDRYSKISITGDFTGLTASNCILLSSRDDGGGGGLDTGKGCHRAGFGTE